MNDALNTIPQGTIIDGKYKTIRLIDAGGMGAVYEAIEISTFRTVAIKVLHDKYCHVDEVVNRFHREARLATSIGHENICEVLGFGSLGQGAPYLVMPLLKGAPLAELLKKDGSLSAQRVSNIISQALSGLAAAHGEGIVHRDMKPDNIFITTGDKGDDFVKLVDFGVSKLIASAGGSIYTKEGTIIGTPAYMAPEQAKGLKEMDHRIDIYAMGVILYEIMTGGRPYGGTTTNETVFKIIGEPFLAPRRRNSDISPEMEQVIIKAMAKDPSARFGSALEMRRAFRQAAGTVSLPPSRETSAPTAVSNFTVPFDLPDGSRPTPAMLRSPSGAIKGHTLKKISLIVAAGLLVLAVVYILFRSAV